MSWSEFTVAARRRGFVENTLKESLSKSMWDTRVTTGACRERDRGQFLWML